MELKTTTNPGALGADEVKVFHWRGLLPRTPEIKCTYCDGSGFKDEPPKPPDYEEPRCAICEGRGFLPITAPIAKVELRLAKRVVHIDGVYPIRELAEAPASVPSAAAPAPAISNHEASL